MTDPEQQLIAQLITASWPLRWQIIFALAIVGGYFIWSQLYFRVVDPVVRAYISRMLGLQIIWVLRHSSSYPTAFEFGFERYHRWSWGIATESQRTFLRDGMTMMLSLLWVNILAGLWPVAVFLLVSLGLQALSYIVFLPTCVATLAIYAIFWSGRYEVTGMR